MSVAPTRPAIAICLLLAALGACTAFRVDTDYDPAARFDTLRRWAWLEVDRPAPTDPRLDNDLLDARVRRSVEAALAARGYEQTRTDPDFLVLYHAGVERKIDVQTYVDTYPRGYRWHAGPVYTRTQVHEYDVGTLILDVVSAKEKRLLWRGATQARVDLDGTPQEREERVRAAVDAILAKYPPQ